MSDSANSVSADPVSAPSSAPNSGIPELQPCDITREEFKAERLKLDSLCPICAHPVGRHARESLRKVSFPVVANDPAPAAAPPAAAVSDYSRIRWDFPKIMQMLTSKNCAWRRESSNSTQISSQFFASIEIHLAPYAEFKETEWMKLLPSLMEDQVNSGAWVLKNIVEHQPPYSWSAVKAAFASHFDRADLIQVLRARMHAMRMKTSETVLSFTNRYIELASQLGYTKGDQEPRTIMDMIERVTPELQKQYRLKQLGLAEDQLLKLTSIQAVANELIALNQAMNPVIHSESNDRDTEKRVRSTSPSGVDRSDRALMCRFHPKATDHSTSQCRKNKFNSDNFKRNFDRLREASDRGSFPPKRVRFSTDRAGKSDGSSATGSAASDRDPICFNCNQSGHIRPNCPQLNANRSSSAPGFDKKPFANGGQKLAFTKTSTGIREHGKSPTQAASFRVQESEQRDHDDCEDSDQDAASDRS